MTNNQNSQWQDSMRIRFDFNNMMNDVLGERGISRTEIDALRDPLAAADRALAGPTAPANGLCLMAVYY